MDNFGTKELYDVALKTTFNMEGQTVPTISENPIIFKFDKLQTSTFIQNISRRNATGGVGGKSLITWEDTRSVEFNCTQGIISTTGLSVLSNSKLVSEINNSVLIPQNGEQQMSDKNGLIRLKHIPVGKVFIRLLNGQTQINVENKQEINIGSPNTLAIIDYYYNYTNKFQKLEIGNQLYDGFLSLEGRMRVKDDKDGHEKTGLITIPNIKIMSGLILRLDESGSGSMNDFTFVGYPVGIRGNQYVCSITFLDEDIDSDF